MKILIVNHYAGSPEHGMEYRPYYLAREWRNAGHSVRIVASSFSHLRRINPSADVPLCRSVHNGIEYVWLRTPRYSGNGIGRLRNILAFVAALYRRSWEFTGDFPPDAVIASSTYPLDIFPASRIAARHRAALVYEVHDLWPLSPMQLAGMSRWHPFVIGMQTAEDSCYRKADLVVSILPAAKPHMLARGMDERKYLHVPNGLDLAEWNGLSEPAPPAHADAIRALREEYGFVLGYTGGHAVSNALDDLLDAAGSLDREAAIVLVGDGVEKERLQRRAETMNLRNVRFLPSVPRRSIPAILGLFDALYIGWRDLPYLCYGVSPNKIFDYMMAGRPVVHAINTPSDVIRDSGAGLTIPPCDHEALRSAVLRLKRLAPDERDAMGLKGRAYVQQHHQYRILAGRFMDGIERALGSIRN